MRVLLLNTSFPPQLRSAANLFHELGVTLTQKGHEVSVVTEFPWRRMGAESVNKKYPGLRFFQHEWMDGVLVLRVLAFPFREGGMIGRGINALLIPLTFWFGAERSGRHDIVLIYSPPLTMGLAAFLYKWHRGMPWVLNVQDIYPQTLIELNLLKNRLFIRFFEWMEDFAYRHAERIVVHSEGNRQYLIQQRNVPPNKIVVIHNWVDTDIIQPAERMNDFRRQHELGEKYVVCYAGTMGYAQNLDPILEVAEQVQAFEDILFLLVGEGVREQEWKDKVQTRGLTNVRFLPLQRAAVYPFLIAASDVGLVPLSEHLHTPVVPGKLLDIMAGGRPVIGIVDPEGDCAKIIQDANCGFVVKPDDPERLAGCIVQLYQDHAGARQLGANGRAYAVQNFSRGVCTAQYEALFQEILQRSYTSPNVQGTQKIIDLSICIVTRQRKELLRECLQSICQTIHNMQYEIIVVDNNSQDGTIAMLREEFPDVLLLVNDHNAGFAAPCNQALKASDGQYALLLNNDTIVLPYALERILRFMADHPEVGICGPKVLNRDGTLQKQCRRSFAPPWDLFCYFSGLATLFPKSRLFGRYLVSYEDENKTHPVDAVSGSCMLIRREVINQIGLFDERFFAYQEDADYCFRAKQAGWLVYYYPEAQIIHYGGLGGSRINPFRSIFEWHRSYFLYYRKNLASQYFFLFNWIYYFAMLLKLASSLLVNLFRPEKFAGSKKP